MSVADILGDFGRGALTGAKTVGAVSQPILERTTQVLSGEAPQIDEEQRQQAAKLDDAALNAKADELESQLEMGRKYGTLTPQQQDQYVTAISNLFSHPRHMNTLMTRLQRAIHPNGATYQPNASLPNATPSGGTAGADIELQNEANREKALTEGQIQDQQAQQSIQHFVDAYKRQNNGAEPPKDMLNAFTLAAYGGSGVMRELEQERTAEATEKLREMEIQIRKDTLAFQEAKQAAAEDPNSFTNKLKLQQLQGQLERDYSYYARYYGEYQGTTPGGITLPGALLLPGGGPVGSTLAGNYFKSSQAMSQLNDAKGAINSVGTSLKALYDSGSSLNNPNVVAALANPEWTVNKLLQGIAAKTLTPQEVDAVVSIKSARENIQGMRKAAGGGLSNEQVDRLEAQLPGPNTPNYAYAQSQLGYLNQTLGRLSEGVPQASGGYGFGGTPSVVSTGAKPVGKILPKVGAKPVVATPLRPATVPANAIWNPSGNNGRGVWQIPQ